MKFSWFMLIDIGLYFLYSMLKPKKKPEEPPKNLEVPSETIGRPIGVLFGTRTVKTPIIGWWGDLQIIKAKIDQQGKK